MSIAKLVLSVFVIAAIGSGCSSDKQITSSQQNPVSDLAKLTPNNLNKRFIRLEPKYSYIRSYPSGGGVFVLRKLPESLTPEHTPQNYRIKINAHPDLNAELITTFSGRVTNIIEITVKPSPDIEIGLHRIGVAVFHDGYAYRTPLEVDILPGEWSDDSWAVAKRDEFLPWLETYYPEFGDLAGLEWRSHFTYPYIWIVEHWTFLSEKYEFRVCWHVMIPPDDWSMMWIRERGRWDASLALKRESDGTINPISIDEYPDFFGY